MKGRLYLAGGGSPEQSEAIDAAWLNDVYGSGRREVVYVPYAQKPEKHDAAIDWFVSTYGTRLGDIAIRYPAELENGLDLTDTAGVYIGGGKTNRLMDAMRTSGLFERLREYISQGGIVYGGSAGAIMLGADIRTAPEVESDYHDMAGLDMLEGHAVACHYGTPDGLSPSQLVDLSQHFPIIAIPETSGVIVDRGQLQVVGDPAVDVWSMGHILEHPL